MPFFDDTGVDTGERSPLWSTFSIIRDQLEALIVVNVVWAIQWIPALAAFAWSEIPAPFRVVMIGYTLIAYAPATVVLYGMVRYAAQGETLHPYLAVDLLKERGLNGARTLVPLIGILGVFILGSAIPNVLISAMCQLLILLLLVFSNYWGVLIAARKFRNPIRLLDASMRISWKYPAQTAILSGAVLVAVVIGTISIGGWVLIVPVVIALLQTQMYRFLME